MWLDFLIHHLSFYSLFRHRNVILLDFDICSSENWQYRHVSDGILLYYTFCIFHISIFYYRKSSCILQIYSDFQLSKVLKILYIKNKTKLPWRHSCQKFSLLKNIKYSNIKKTISLPKASPRPFQSPQKLIILICQMHLK